VALIRLNYAVEMRYGVVVDLAARVLAGETIALAMGNFNCVGRGDANASPLRAFDHVANPPAVINVTGPETLGVRGVCEQLGRMLGKEPRFTGKEAPTAYLNN